MTFPLVQSTAVTNFSADQTSHVVNLPAGIQAGDRLLIWFCADSTGGTVTTPTGWTLLQGPINQTDRSLLYSRTADGTEGTTVTIATSVAESSSSVALRVSGVVSVVSSSGSASSGSYANGPTVTPTASVDCVLLQLVSAIGSATVATVPNGAVATASAAGDSANANGTVMAAAAWANACSQNAVNSVVMPLALSSSVAHRMATVLLQGTGAAAGFPVSRLVC